ncbi:hypothetical protein [Benzoatithermus flavus]|uniref:Uncharacterized protein n=1 Tax=Benzoatithermus flavus TaxID=3108223 RepID=A0ABU8XPE0_9PROT
MSRPAARPARNGAAGAVPALRRRGLLSAACATALLAASGAAAGPPVLSPDPERGLPFADGTGWID